MRKIFPYLIAPFAPFLIVLGFDPSVATDLTATSVYLGLSYAFTVPSLVAIRIFEIAIKSRDRLKFILYGAALGGFEGISFSIIAGTRNLREVMESGFVFGLFGCSAAIAFVLSGTLLTRQPNRVPTAD